MRVSQTWLRVGGPADWLFQPADLDDLQAFLRDLPPEAWPAAESVALDVRGSRGCLAVADALLAVPYMPASNYAAYGLHRVTGEFFDTWTALVITTRRIYEATKGQPWA